jgi:hypothetical protein
MTGRARLDALGPILQPARELRNVPDAIFADVADDELAVAARALRAISYSCVTGAAKLERIVHLRQQAAAR